MVFNDKLNLGKLGEDTFSLWCTQARIVSNRSSDEDVTGWDHHIEFPYVQNNKPSDKLNPPIECKIQIKSTQRKDRRLSIKASTLKRLIDYSYPTFILFFEFDKQSELENSFLVHIDKIIIDKVLREIRKNHISANPKELHKLKISIRYGDENKLALNTGIFFRDKIVSLVPNIDINRYQINKRNVVKHIGYDDFNFQLRFNANHNDLNTHILQNIIRGKSKLIVNDFEVLENRFNLPDGDMILHHLQEGSLIITPSIIETCNLYFKISENSPAITFNVEVFHLPNISINSRNLLVFRYTSFALVIDFSERKKDTHTLKLIQDQCTGIPELLKTLKIIQFFTESSEIFVGVDFKGYKQFPSKLMHSNINANISLLIKPLEKIIGHFHLDSSYETTLDYLANNYASILFISKIISNDLSNICFPDEKIEYKGMDLLDMPFFRYIELYDKFIGVSCIIQTKRTKKHQFIAINFKDIDCFLFTDKIKLESYINELNLKIKNTNI